MPAIRLAVFDVDGTLIDSQHNIVAAMAAAFDAHGLAAADAAAVRRIIGLSLVEAIAALLPMADAALHHAIAGSYKEAFFDLRQRPGHDEPLFPGALTALATLEEAGWLLAIATGKSQRGVRATIERHDLHGRFLSVQTADENPGKPHPGMLLSAMAALGAMPAATMMIGDTSYDMLMARNAGTAAVGVSWGYHRPEELLMAGAAGVIDGYDTLAPLLDGILRERACVRVPS